MTDMTRYEPTDTTYLIDPATDSWIATVADVTKLAGYLCDTEFVPNGFRGNAPATAAAILYGREIGVAPMTALSMLHIVHGRVGMAAELMRARALAAGHEVEFIETTAAVCRVRGRRKGSQTWTEVQWSKGDAQQAGLRGDNWTKYPRAMLVARATSELCRLVFPDVTHGMASTEELDGLSPATGEAAPAAPARKVARATRGPAPETPVPEGGSAAPPPVPVPETPSPEVGPAPSAEPPVTPGDGPPPEAPLPPLPTSPVSHVPGELDPPLPIEVPPEEGEDDPRVQGELRGDAPATRPQARHIMVLLRKCGMGETRDERLRVAEAIVQRRVTSFNELTITDAGHIITALILASESTQPRDYLRWLVDEGHLQLAEREARARGEVVGNE
jgi:hypothetical protein